MRSYGKILRVLRKRAGYTLMQAASALGALGYETTNTNMSRWENGYNNPTLEQFVALCRLYGVQDIFQTFGLEQIPEEGPGLDRDGMAQLESYRDLLLKSALYCKEPDTSIDYELLGTRRVFTPDPLATEYKKEYDEDGLESIVQVRCYMLNDVGPIYELEDSRNFEVVPLPARAPDSVTFMVIMNGDSNDPLIPDGSVLWMTEAENIEQPGQIFLCLMNGQPLLAMVEEERGIPLELRFFNPAFDPVPIRPEDNFSLQGRVVGPPLRIPMQIQGDPTVEAAVAALG